MRHSTAVLNIWTSWIRAPQWAERTGLLYWLQVPQTWRSTKTEQESATQVSRPPLEGLQRKQQARCWETARVCQILTFNRESLSREMLKSESLTVRTLITRSKLVIDTFLTRQLLKLSWLPNTSLWQESWSQTISPSSQRISHLWQQISTLTSVPLSWTSQGLNCLKIIS